MLRNTIEIYNGKVWGCEVSKYGLETGYLDYLTLSEMIGGHILNNNIITVCVEEWEIISGEFKDEVYQYYIITENGAKVLEEFGEIVFYNETLDMYVWGVTHLGTSWDYVLTGIKLIEKDDVL